MLDRENNSAPPATDNQNIEPDNDFNSSGTAPLKRSQKIGVLLLVLFSVGVFLFWGIDMRREIYGSKTNKTSVNTSNNTDTESGTCQGVECLAQAEAELKNIDTDNDGLNDWDEYYTYKTSPYLEDSDSDSYSDFDEINSGNDPNCPEGRDCGSQLAVPDTVNSSMKIEEPAATETGSELDEVRTQALEILLSGQSDVRALRQALLAAGMETRILDQISDEDLMRSYQETLGSN